MSLSAYHERNWNDAVQFFGVLVVVAGAGSTGGLVAENLGSKGFDLRLLDRDRLELANLHRHCARKRYVAGPKAEGTALSLREELPAEQVISFADVDIVEATESELSGLLEDAALVVGATGSRPADLRLNHLCRTLGIPYLSLALWPGGDDALGHAHLSPWSGRSHSYGDRILACVSCSGPGRGEALEAQAGSREDVQAVVILAVRIISCLCLPETDPRARWLADHLAGGENFLFVRRADNAIVGADTEDAVRSDCPEADGDLGRALRERRWRHERRQILRNGFLAWVVVTVLAILISYAFDAVRVRPQLTPTVTCSDVTTRPVPSPAVAAEATACPDR